MTDLAVKQEQEIETIRRNSSMLSADFFFF